MIHYNRSISVRASDAIDKQIIFVSSNKVGWLNTHMEAMSDWMELCILVLDESKGYDSEPKARSFPLH